MSTEAKISKPIRDCANSNDEIIVIDDDDDDKNSNSSKSSINGHCATEDSRNREKHTTTFELSPRKKRDLRKFMEISNVSSESRALFYLHSSDFNLEQAISDYLDQHMVAADPVMVAACDPKSNGDDVDIGAANFPEGMKQENILPEKGANVDEVHSDEKIASGSVAAQPQRNTIELSDQWKDCHQNLLQERQFFVDPDFPPTMQSLDGRKRYSSSSAGADRIHCHCGLPAAARQVQSDGPNYGKFYLCCGQKPWPKKPAPPRHKQSYNNGNKNEDEKSTMPNRYNNAKREARNDDTTNNEENDEREVAPRPVTNDLKCNFFRWDPSGSLGAASTGSDGYATMRFSLLAWQSFGIQNGCCLYNPKSGVDPSQVQQGAVGNCWFLSALAVVAEKPYLVRQVLPHTELNESGCYQINLCLDGKWTPIIVDSYLPVVVRHLRERANTIAQGGSPTEIKFRGRECVPFDLCRRDFVAFPAFCATPDRQIWASLVEKAYAKAHGSYAQLSGGFIAEGLLDLTGAPFETIVFHGNILDRQVLWARLLSFREAGFLMGVATSKGGDGLVGGHAYSVLDVVEIPNAVVGEQLKVTEFFGGSPSRKKQKVDHVTRTAVRLVRIRNPWGKREWKGAWSVNSEQWTKYLRTVLGSSSNAKSDGTFWISYEDMLQRFHHMDVGKTRECWTHQTADGCFVSQKDPLHAAESVFRIVASQRTPAFVSIVQPKKRSNTGNNYWYIDPSFIVLRRALFSNSDADWVCEASSVVGVKRISSCEVFIDPRFEYICIPFSCMASHRERGENLAFRLCTYSAAPLSVNTIRSKDVLRNQAVVVLHSEILRVEQRLLYSVAPAGLLACLQGHGCLYFLAINCEVNRFLSLHFSLDVPKGIFAAFGSNGSTHDIPPRSQKVIAMATCDGKFSTATSLKFSYVADNVQISGSFSIPKPHNAKLGATVDVTMIGDLLVGSINQAQVSSRGGDRIDTCLWIHQIGC